MNSCPEVGCGLVIPGCNHPELLDFGEDILNPVPGQYSIFYLILVNMNT